MDEKHLAYLLQAWHLTHPGRPNIRRREQPRRTIRVPDRVWNDAQAAARKIGRPLPKIIVELLREFVEEAYWRERAEAAEAEAAALRAQIERG